MTVVGGVRRLIDDKYKTNNRQPSTDNRLWLTRAADALHQLAGFARATTNPFAQEA